MKDKIRQYMHKPMKWNKSLFSVIMSNEDLYQNKKSGIYRTYTNMIIIWACYGLSKLISESNTQCGATKRCDSVICY